ncbi:MAG: ORF6N domain-containing protein [Steroidobacteraceae bacterium]
MPGHSTTVPIEHITQSIVVVRGQKVLLDSTLAGLCGVGTKRLNEQVKRNLARFPKDFLFRLTQDEIETLNRSHFATGSQKHRDPRFPPHAFTEHGAIMAATVLNTAPRGGSGRT